jgi:hypothetical protein
LLTTFPVLSFSSIPPLFVCFFLFLFASFVFISLPCLRVFYPFLLISAHFLFRTKAHDLGD